MLHYKCQCSENDNNQLTSQMADFSCILLLDFFIFLQSLLLEERKGLLEAWVKEKPNCPTVMAQVLTWLQPARYLDFYTGVWLQLQGGL